MSEFALDALGYVSGPRRGEVWQWYELDEKPGPHDQTVRACRHCGGPLRWRYRQGVTWDRGLPVCPKDGLLTEWAVLSRDGRRLLGLARLDAKGRVFAEARDLADNPIRPRAARSGVRHHQRVRHDSGQKTLFNIDARHTAPRIGPAAWAGDLAPWAPIEEVTE